MILKANSSTVEKMWMVKLIHTAQKVKLRGFND